MPHYHSVFSLCRRRRSPVALASVALCAVMLMAMFVGRSAVAQETASEAGFGSAPLTVAVREVPPFAMKDEAGNWEGVSVDLWRYVADHRNLDFEWREASLEQTIGGLRTGDVDIAIAAMSVTGEREEFVDFSHPYFVTGLSVAYSMAGGSAWLATLKGFFSLQFLAAVGSLAAVLLAAGFAVWLFERKANAEEFGHGDIGRGLGDGFWWSAVTMTTVGYGDKAPKTAGGRLVALVWMFLSLIIIASFTASIAASLTANELAESLFRDRPLSSLRVGVLEGSSAESFAGSRGSRTVSYESVDETIQALAAGEVDAVLHDAPILRYEVRNADVDVEIAKGVLVREDYAFAFPESSPIRNEVNIALLSILYEPAWQNIKSLYLGETENVL